MTFEPGLSGSPGLSGGIIAAGEGKRISTKTVVLGFVTNGSCQQMHCCRRRAKGLAVFLAGDEMILGTRFSFVDVPYQPCAVNHLAAVNVILRAEFRHSLLRLMSR